MVGKSTCGSGATGMNGKLIIPTKATAAIISEVAIGRWMKGSERFISGLPSPLSADLGDATLTAAPRDTLYWPSVITRSPSLSPLVTMVRSPVVGPTSIGRGSAVFFSVTIQVNRPCGPRCTAAAGTAMALARVSKSSRALTKSPGQSFSSSFGNSALRRIVAVA